MKKYYRGFILTMVSAVIFGSSPLAAKIIYEGGCNPISLVLYRNLLPIPLLFMMAHKNEKAEIGIKKSEFKKITILAIFGSVLTATFLFSSYNYISTGTATTIHFIYPVMVFIASIIFLKEPVTIKKLICIILCAIGIALFYTPGEGFSKMGLILALISGITYSIYIIYLDESGLDYMDRFKLNFYMCLISSILLLAFTLATNTLTFSLTPKAWFITLLFSLSLNIFAVIPFQIGVSLISPQRASIISTFEPITSIIIGILILNEPFSLKILTGCVLILLSVILLTIFDMKLETLDAKT